MRTASLMLIVKDGLILSICRRQNRSKFGLIGGQVEEGESPRDAAIRETKQECGLDVSSCEAILVREETDYLAGSEVFMTHCYYAMSWTGTPEPLEGLELRWLTIEELISSEIGAFPEYNSKAIAAFKMKFPGIELQENISDPIDTNVRVP